MIFFRDFFVLLIDISANTAERGINTRAAFALHGEDVRNVGNADTMRGNVLLLSKEAHRKFHVTSVALKTTWNSTVM